MANKIQIKERYKHRARVLQIGKNGRLVNLGAEGEIKHQVDETKKSVAYTKVYHKANEEDYKAIMARGATKYFEAVDKDGNVVDTSMTAESATGLQAEAAKLMAKAKADAKAEAKKITNAAKAAAKKIEDDAKAKAAAAGA